MKHRLLFCSFLTLLVLTGLAQAARVQGLYSAEVELAANTANARSAAFSQALAEVLVKVTGQNAVVERQRELFPNASQFIQQYRNLDAGRIWVQFDERAVREVLDTATLPVWGAERPAVVVWMVIDEGQGQRSILGTADNSIISNVGNTDAYRKILIERANARGLPIILPLLDAEDLSQVSAADIWGGFGDVTLAASKRYGADVALIGRLRKSGSEGVQVRWSLLIAESKTPEWNGSIADGPDGVADILALQLATFAASADAIILTVKDMKTLDQYATVLNYLRSLPVVEYVGVSRVMGTAVEFAVTSRSDSDRLKRDIRRGNLLYELEVEAISPSIVSDTGETEWSSYRLADGLIYSLKE
ncbi:MAG: DUF2066 domain-containing protein [Gammaproteobacteria bacterium]|nr:DUF2066 domain-containing protein [Gammaproteobacteria bacterium]